MPLDSSPTSLPAVYSLDGLLVFGLLLVCTCAYLRKVPRLRAWLLSERRGIWGVCHKGEGHWGHGGMVQGCWEHWDGGIWNTGVQDAGITGVRSGAGALGSGWGHWILGWGHRDLGWEFWGLG